MEGQNLVLSITDAVYNSATSANAETGGTIINWAMIIASVIAYLGVITAQILTYQNNLKAEKIKKETERRTAVFYELKGIQITLPQYQYSCYEKGIDAKVHETLWLRDIEKNLFNKEQAVNFQNRQQELTILVTEQIKNLFEKLGEATLLFYKNEEIMEMIRKIESTPLYLNYIGEFPNNDEATLMIKRSQILSKYNDICNRNMETLDELNQLIRMELMKNIR
jgi:hypothetical protein